MNMRRLVLAVSAAAFCVSLIYVLLSPFVAESFWDGVKNVAISICAATISGHTWVREKMEKKNIE